jgi:hypothetical protein
MKFVANCTSPFAVDFAALSTACLITLVYTTCLSFTEDDANPSIVSDTAMEVLQSRGLTLPILTSEELERCHLVASPQYLDPEKLDEKTGDDLYGHIFDGCDGEDFDKTPEGFIRSVLLHVDREGKPLPEDQTEVVS